jgi:hypothetical protein
MPSRLTVMMASALVALAIAVPSYAQGNSGGKKPPKGPTKPPSSSAVSTPTTTSSTADLGVETTVTTTTPFAWLDDASVMTPGNVWLGVSTVRWQGSGQSQTIVPVVDAAIGLTPRVQLSASVPRVAGGLGTTFFTAKIAVLNDDARAFKLAIGPTLEILDGVAVGQGRAEWGLPVSVQLDHAGSRIYGSSGYFSPGIWYAGAGIGRSVGDRVGISMSYSHAWATSPSSPEVPGVAGPRRNEISGGASYDLKPNIAVFGSISRTMGVAAEDGAGTTLGFGLSLSAAPTLLTR